LKAWVLLLCLAAGAWAAPAMNAVRSLAFEPAGPGAYVARGDRFSVTVGAAHTALSLKGQPVLRTRFAGAREDSAVAPIEPTGAKVHYLVGNDPKRWRTDVPTYARVAVSELYPGIDLVHYGKGGRLEYDFVVKPGADPRAIRLAFTGQERIRIDRAGALVLAMGGRTVKHEAPFLYQDTPRGRKRVSGRWAFRPGGEVGFAVGRYDRKQPLVIDPILEFSTYLGSSGTENAWPHMMTTDAAGATYVTGQSIFQAAAPVPFPISAGAFQSGPPAAEQSGERAFVTKFRPDGAIEWSTYLCGTKNVTQTGEESGRAITVCGNGQACVVGRTTSTDFPTANAYQAAFKGVNVSAFAVRLNAAGNGLVWGTYFGGVGDASAPGAVTPADSGANAVAHCPGGNAYFTGFGGVPVSAGAFQGPAQQPNLNARSAFVAKIAVDGQLVFSTLIASKAVSEGHGIAVDRFNETYVTGATFPPAGGDPEFPTTTGAFRTVRAAGNTRAAFATKLNAGATGLVYSNLLSGRHSDIGYGVALTEDLHAYVVGATTSDNFPGVSVIQDRQISMPWVLQFCQGGDRSLLGGQSNLTPGQSGGGLAYDVAVAPDACAVISGVTSELLFPTVRGQTDLLAKGADSDGFLVKIARRATDRRTQTYLGISTGGQAFGVRVAGTGRVTVAGTAAGTLPQTTAGAPQASKPGGVDAFVARIAAPLANRDRLGDGASSLLLRNDTTGETYFWTVKDERMDAGPLIGTIDARSYEVQGYNDLDGNGTPDIIWRCLTSGQVFAWYYDGPDFLSSTPVFSLDLGWRLEGAGDFDGDGHQDLMIRNSTSGDTWIYYMQRTVPRAAARIGNISTSFAIGAIGDFDADGIADFVLSNRASGEQYFWLMSRPSGSTAVVKSVRFFLTLPLNYRFEGTCDANGDGLADLMLRALSDGGLYFYVMCPDMAAAGAPSVRRALFAGRPDARYGFKNR
jgi:hypothetical protein